MARKTRMVRIHTEVQLQFATECDRRGFVIQDKATEALVDKMIEWEAEDDWQALQAQAQADIDD